MFSHRIDHDVELRLLHPRHAEAVFALIERSREHLGRWLGWVGGWRTIDDVRAYIKDSLYRTAENGGMFCGIWHQGELVGTIDLINVNLASKRAEIGFWLGGEFEGRGLVIRACRTLIDHAFGAMELDWLVIHTKTENVRSRAVAERLGFQHDGYLRHHDREAYTLYRNEWRGRGSMRFTHPLRDDADLELLLPWQG